MFDIDQDVQSNQPKKIMFSPLINARKHPIGANLSLIQQTVQSFPREVYFVCNV